MEADFKEKTWSLQKKIHSSFFIFFPIKTCWWTLCWCNPCLFIYNSCLTFITFVYLCHFQRNAPAVGFLYPQNNGFNSFGDKNMDIFPMTWSFPTLRWNRGGLRIPVPWQPASYSCLAKTRVTGRWLWLQYVYALFSRFKRLKPRIKLWMEWMGWKHQSKHSEDTTWACDELQFSTFLGKCV